MKLLTVAICFSLLGGTPSFADQSGANSNQTTHSTRQSSASKPTVAGSAEPSIPNEPSCKDQAPSKNPSKVDILTMPTVAIDRPYTGIRGIIYDWGPWAFALLLVIVSGFQALLLARQAKIMEDHRISFDRLAKAASLNAQAVLNAERPWVIVTAKIQPSKLGIASETFELYGEVKGRTPAIILQGWAEEPALSVKHESELPEEPVYKSTERSRVAHELLIVPGDPPFSIYLTPTHVPLNSQKCLDLQEMKEEMYFYGRLVYVDMLEKDQSGKPVIRETRWCFRYIPGNPGFVVRGGKTAYNHYS
jgi:hypothetical protein